MAEWPSRREFIRQPATKHNEPGRAMRTHTRKMAGANRRYRAECTSGTYTDGVPSGWPPGTPHKVYLGRAVAHPSVRVYLPQPGGVRVRRGGRSQRGAVRLLFFGRMVRCVHSANELWLPRMSGQRRGILPAYHRLPGLSLDLLARRARAIARPNRIFSCTHFALQLTESFITNASF